MEVKIYTSPLPFKVKIYCENPDLVSVVPSIPKTIIVSIVKNGTNGKSAYQSALDNGFVGTEAEWLDFLKGLSAYGVAVFNGFVGTEAEWLLSLKGADAINNTLEMLRAHDNTFGGDVSFQSLGTIKDIRLAVSDYEATPLVQVQNIVAAAVSDMEDYADTAASWGAVSGDINAQADLMAKFDEKLNAALVGAANGVTPLDSGIKIPLQYFPDELLGNVKFRGTYNGVIVSSASSTYNGLALPTPVAQNAGIYFIVTAEFFKDTVKFDVGDWILSLGTTGYSKVDNSDSVTSVFGRIGNVVANSADYAAFYPLLATVYNDPVWIGSLAKSKVGLSNVDNTSDVNKPVSTAQATAIATKEPIINAGVAGQWFRWDKIWAAISKSDVGLGNVDNTSDANKPVSTAQATAIATKEPIINAGVAGQWFRWDKSWAALTKSDVGLTLVDNTSDSAKPISLAQQTAFDARVQVILNITADAALAIGATTEQLITTIIIPANTFATGDKINVDLWARRSITGAGSVVRIRTNTTGINPTTGTLLAASNSFNSQFIIPIIRSMWLKAGNILEVINPNNTANGFGVSTTDAIAQVAFNPTVQNYIYITGQPSSTTDQIIISAIEILRKKLRAAV